jgi:hypothetical protein
VSENARILVCSDLELILTFLCLRPSITTRIEG